MKIRPVKIVATIGPVSRTAGMIARFIDRGADVFRLNFSHGTFEEHGRIIDRIRKASRKAGRPVSILQDLPGPKVRIGALGGGKLVLSPGDDVVIAPPGKPETIPVDMDDFAGVVSPADHIMMADGAVELEVVRVSGKEILCRVITGGTVSSRKGITLPSRKWVPKAFTSLDREALAFGLSMGIDYAALSFVGSAEDIQAAKDFLGGRGAEIPLVAKIETRRALDNLKDIADEADGLMAARGDLGVEIPLEEIPQAQKKIVHTAGARGKPVIVATQMLGSMTNNPRPSRAETTDVAGAVWSGADAVMLSEETAVGAYPLEAVSTMARIIEAASREPLSREVSFDITGTAEAISHAACLLAIDLGAAAIVAATESGSTAAAVSRFRPPCPIIGLTPNKETANRLALLWGVVPVFEKIYTGLDDMVIKAAQAARQLGLADTGSKLVCTAGLPFRKRGGTDLIRVISVD